MAKVSSILRSDIFSFINRRNSRGVIFSAWPPLAAASSKRAFRVFVTAIRRKLAIETPGITVGYWKARKIPFWARMSGSHSRMSSPLYRMLPSVTS